MCRFLRKGMIFGFIIALALSVVNSSSGISQFSSNREVGMRVVDSENALISLPEVIEVDVTMLERTIEYYKLITITNTEEEEQEEGNGEVIQMDDTETNSPQVIREIVDTFIETKLINTNNTFTIKNNMPHSIDIISIEENKGLLDFNLKDYQIQPWESIIVTIEYIGDIGEWADDICQWEENLEIELYFKWDGGNSIIYKDVVINYLKIGETIEMEITDNGK